MRVTLGVAESDGTTDNLYSIETLRFNDGDYAVTTDASQTFLTNASDSADVITLNGAMTATFEVPEPTAAVRTRYLRRVQVLSLRL